MRQALQASVARIEKAIGGQAKPKKEEAFGAGYPNFTAKNHSLLKKHLTPAVYELLKDKVGDLIDLIDLIFE